jgi:hypothetical protein
MRNTLSLCRGVLLSFALLMLPGAVAASGFSDKLAEKVTKDRQTQEQIKNAFDTVEAELESYASTGETTRGASGPMMQLLYSSDTLICGAWIISFRQELQRLVVSDWLNPPLSLIRAAQDLLSKVERACMPVLDPDTVEAMKAGGSASGGAAPATAQDEPAGGRPFVPRPGWTITDEICARQCEKESAAAFRADWNQYRAEQNEKTARDRQTAAERELGAERENLARAEARLQSARSNLQRLEDFNRRAGGTPTKGSGSDLNLSNARARVRDGEREVTQQRRRVETKEQEAAAARRSADQARSARERAEQEAKAAHDALEACLRDCYRRAAAASGASPGSAGGTSSTGISSSGTSSTGTSAGSSGSGTSGTSGSGSHLPLGGGY